MEYRTTTFKDEGFDSEEEEFEAMRDYVSHLMLSTDPDDMMDTLVIMANVCEQRAITLNQLNSTLATWYRTAGQAMRALLTVLTYDKDSPRPNAKLENTFLYFPEPMVMN